MADKYKEKSFEVDSSAPFNMAIDTLQRLGELFREIKLISADFTLKPEIRQKMKLNLTKQFFIQAIPLLPSKIIESHRRKIVNLQMKMTNLVDWRKKFVGVGIYFSEELEVYLDELLIELQLALQKEKYFMPPKSDPKYGWKQS